MIKKLRCIGGEADGQLFEVNLDSNAPYVVVQKHWSVNPVLPETAAVYSYYRVELLQTGNDRHHMLVYEPLSTSQAIYLLLRGYKA